MPAKLPTRHAEIHRTDRIGWLRAAVLGANDGIVSTASLVLGVAAAGADAKSIMIAGVAGLVAGASSMAAGEYVSVSSQSDTERADLDRERRELASDPQHELAEMTAIYVARGVSHEVAAVVATQLMAHDALGTHAREELGISHTSTARPLQAALASAATFSVGAALPSWSCCWCRDQTWSGQWRVAHSFFWRCLVRWPLPRVALPCLPPPCGLASGVPWRWLLQPVSGPCSG